MMEYNSKNNFSDSGDQNDLKQKNAELIRNIDKLEKKIVKLEKYIAKNDNSSNDTSLQDINNDYQRAFLELEQKKNSEIAKLSRELSNKEYQISIQKEELSLNLSSINFIKDILNAKETGSVNYNNLNKVIAKFEYFVKEQFFQLASYVHDVIQNPGHENKEMKKEFEERRKYWINSFDEWASTRKKDWLYHKTAIAFVGEFSAGKTSIVNRILSQDDPKIPRLPVSTKATTAIATYISGAEQNSYSFISGDNKRKDISEETFKKISKEVLDQVKGISSLIKYFVMTYKNKNLQGLSVLDTPGFSSNDKEDIERTIEVINECDALFWVIDVNNGTVNRSSLSVIKENLRRPIYVVINKVDTKAPSEVDSVIDNVKKAFDKEGLKVQQFIRFSAKADLSKIMEPIKSIKRREIRDKFVTELRDIINKNVSNWGELLKEFESLSEQNDDNFYNTIDQLCNNMEYLEENCEYINNSMDFISPFLGSDRYEYSKEDGQKVQRILRKLSKMPNVLHKIVEDIMEQTRTNVSLQVQSKEINWAYTLAVKCKEELDSIRTELKEITKDSSNGK